MGFTKVPEKVLIPIFKIQEADNRNGPEKTWRAVLSPPAPARVDRPRTCNFWLSFPVMES
jgi:hypothetical protein